MTVTGPQSLAQQTLRDRPTSTPQETLLTALQDVKNALAALLMSGIALVTDITATIRPKTYANQDSRDAKVAPETGICCMLPR